MYVCVSDKAVKGLADKGNMKRHFLCVIPRLLLCTDEGEGHVSCQGVLLAGALSPYCAQETSPEAASAHCRLCHIPIPAPGLHWPPPSCCTQVSSVLWTLMHRAIYLRSNRVLNLLEQFCLRWWISISNASFVLTSWVNPNYLKVKSSQK